MSDRRRVNPLLSFSWRCLEEGSALAFTALDPLTNRIVRLEQGDLWILAELGRDPDRAWTREEILELAVQSRALPEQAAQATLSRLWDLAFIEARAIPPDLDASLPGWEEHGSKLALEYYASSLHPQDRAPRAAPSPPADRAVEEGSEGDLLLPAPGALPATPLSAILARRRTCRQFAGRPLAAETLSFILAHALRPGGGEGGGDLGAVPDHLVCHLFAARIDGVPSGVYRVLGGARGLRSLRRCDAGALERELVEMLIGQTYVAGSAAGLLLSGDLDRLIADRPRPSSLRTFLVQVGAVAQRLILLGHARGVESFLSAAILEERARRSTAGDLGGSITPLHQVVFGHGVTTDSP